MDGFPIGLTAMTPILPETMLISEKDGIYGPPVEILPLPDNSFKSDDAATRLLNNPYSLDIKGRTEDNAKAGDGGAPKAGAVPLRQTPATPAEELVMAPRLGEAYTLDLSGKANLPGEVHSRDLSMLKNYELLGRTAARQSQRPSLEGKPAQDVLLSELDVGNTADAGLSARPFGRLYMQPGPLLAEFLAQSDVTFVRDTPALSSVAPELPDAQAEGSILARHDKTSQVSQNPKTELQAFQLTPSDVEAVLTLEPDLQEAFLNMLGSSQNAAGRKEGAPVMSPVATPEELPAELPVRQVADDHMSTPSMPGTIGDEPVLKMPLDLNATLVRLAPKKQPPESAAPLATDDSPLGLSLDSAGRAVAATVGGAAARSSIPAGGDMVNLLKITELPYSMYLFGPTIPEKRPDDEEDAIHVELEMQQGSFLASEFLRLSEAVRMSAVLHNIYYGGHGQFTQETPWHRPYFLYAIQHGIIKADDFSDMNDFATRAEMAYIFSGAVPKDELSPRHQRRDLGDVTEGVGYGDAIYTLYRAGVLTVSNQKGLFHPDRVLTHSEAATIIGRIATPTDRKSF